jgi:hypothetical protein
LVVRRIVVVGAFAAFLSSACGAAEEAEEDFERDLAEALGPDGEVSVDLDPDSGIVRVEGDGTVFVEGVGQGRPDFLAEDVPLPADLVIESSSLIGEITRVAGTTTSTVDDLRFFYAAAASEAGWEIEADPRSIAEEEVIILAYTFDGIPVDVRVDGAAFDLFVGRRWEPPEG